MNGKQLKNSILQWAIQGKLVPQDPNDEPASVLLEKIRLEKALLVKEGKLKKKDLEVKPIAEDEIPFEIPKSWAWVKLGDIFELKSGQDFPPEKYNSNQKGIPYITGASNLDGDTIVMNRWTETPSVIAPKGCLLLVCKGSGVGKLCYMSIDKAHIARQIQAIIPLSENVDITYIRIVLESRISEIIQQANGVIPGIAREVALSFAIPLPPLAEQHRIVVKIKELMPLVEKYGAAQEALDEWNQALPEKLKKSILQEAIQGKLVPQDPADEPASVLLERIREEKKRLVKEGKLKKKDLEVKPIEEDEIPFEIPESWEWVRLHDISKTITKGTTPRGGNVAYSLSGIGFLRAENVGGFDKLDLTNLKYVTEEEHKGFLSRSIIEVSDILITIAGTLGRTALVKKEHLPLNANQAVSIVRLVDSHSLSLKFLIYALNEPNIQKVLSTQRKVTAIPNLTLEIISDCLIPLPPLAEQRRIVAKIEELFGVINN